MEWIKNLPLDTISESLANFLAWWTKLVDGVPDDQLSLVVYVIASLMVILLWGLVVRILPRTMRGISLVFMTAVLFAPGGAEGDSGAIAPAIIGVFYALLTKDFLGMVSASLPILATFVILLVIGAIWQMLRSVIESDAARTQRMMRIKEQKRLSAKSEHLNGHE